MLTFSNNPQSTHKSETNYFNTRCFNIFIMLALLYSLKTSFSLQMFTQCSHFSAIIFAFCSLCCSKWAELANRSRKFSARIGSRFLRELPRAARRNKSVRLVSGLPRLRTVERERDAPGGSGCNCSWFVTVLLERCHQRNRGNDKCQLVLCVPLCHV